MAFRTKLDFSNNRQVKQFEKTQTVLSGGTSFGLTFSALTTGPNPATTGETNSVTFIASTFSGNSATTVYNWYDPAMSLGEPYFTALTPSISSITQTVNSVFTAETTTVIDNNTVVLSYSGVGFDITPIAMYDLGGGAYSGTVETTELFYYSATSLAYTGRTIWVDVSGITRTERLIVTNEPQIGYVLTCYTSEGMAKWDAVTGVTISGGSILWSAGTGTYSIAAKNHDSIASGDYSVAEGFNALASGDYSHAEGYGTTASGTSSHAEGVVTQALGIYSHAEGYYTIASGGESHAEGVQTTASGSFSHAEGNQTIASGNTSHAEGFETIAGGVYSHAEGYYTTAIGDASHAGGSGSTASGQTSFVHGGNSIAGGTNTIVFGVNITGTTADTTYVDNFNINTAPVINNNLDKVLSRDSDGHVRSVEMTKLKTIFSGNYATLSTMVSNNELNPNNKYILTDYKTIYQINGSDSRDRIQQHEIIGSAGLYSQFNNVPSNLAVNGDTVVCVFAPSGATVSTGSTFTIIDYFNNSFIRFSPTITGINNIGVKLQFQKQRYPNVPSGATINDVNVKPVFKSGGVLNTEVHDDGPYMSMTGAENPSPIVEALVLTALDTSTFSIFAESLTFTGDKLEYDFTDTDIYDDNIPANLIGTRNGRILKRENVDRTVSANLDWRVQRYRRFQMDITNWNNFLFNKISGGTSATTASTIYNVGSVNYCTNNNPTISNDHKYVMYEPYFENLYTDFALTVPDPFFSGTSSVPSLGAGQRFPAAYTTTPYSVNVTLPFSGFSGTSLIKDFNIIPISGYQPTTLVDTFLVGDIENSVFVGNSQRYGDTFNLSVKSLNGSINNSTFMSLPNIENNSVINQTISIDANTLINKNEIYGVSFLAYGTINNSGIFRNSSVGSGYVAGQNEQFYYTITDNSFIMNSVLGGYRGDSFYLNNLKINNCLLIHKQVGLSNFAGNMYLTRYKNSGTTYGSNIMLNTFANTIPNKTDYGYVYDFNTDLYDLTVHNDTQNKYAISQIITSGLTFSAITISTVS